MPRVAHAFAVWLPQFPLHLCWLLVGYVYGCALVYCPFGYVHPVGLRLLTRSAFLFYVGSGSHVAVAFTPVVLFICLRLVLPCYAFYVWLVTFVWLRAFGWLLVALRWLHALVAFCWLPVTFAFSFIYLLPCTCWFTFWLVHLVFGCWFTYLYSSVYARLRYTRYTRLIYTWFTFVHVHTHARLLHVVTFYTLLLLPHLHLVGSLRYPRSVAFVFVVLRCSFYVWLRLVTFGWLRLRTCAALYLAFVGLLLVGTCGVLGSLAFTCPALPCGFTPV